VINLMQTDKRTHSIVLKTSQSDVEYALRETFQKMEKDFENISFDIRVKHKKLVPFELVLDITLKVASGVAVGLVIKCLERLWEEFRKKKITPEIQGMDEIQSSAERYLEAIEVTNFRILERKDKGSYVTFVFEDEKKNKHNLIVTSFDLKILHYRREE